MTGTATGGGKRTKKQKVDLLRTASQLLKRDRKTATKNRPTEDPLLPATLTLIKYTRCSVHGHQQIYHLLHSSVLTIFEPSFEGINSFPLFSLAFAFSSIRQHQ